MIDVPSQFAFCAFVVLIFALAVESFRRPATGLTALLCMYGLDQWGQVSSSYILNHGALTNFVVGSITSVALLRRWLAHERFGQIPMSFYWLAALYAYAFTSTLWSPERDTALSLWGHAWPYLFVSLLIVPWLVRDASDLDVAISRYLCIGGLLVLTILVFGHWGSRGLVIPGRPDGDVDPLSQTNPLELGTLGGTVALAALFYRQEHSSILWTAIKVMAGVGGAFLVVRSGARGQFIALIFAGAALLPLKAGTARVGQWIKVVIIVAVGLLVIDFAMNNFVPEGEYRWESSQSSTDVVGRFEMQLKLLGAWSQSVASIVFGLGNSASFEPEINGIYPHNLPVEVLGEEGFIGFAFLLLALIGWAVPTWQAIRLMKPDSEARGCLLTVASWSLFCIIIALKQGNLLSFAVGAAVLLVSSRVAQRALNHPESAARATRHHEATRNFVDAATGSAGEAGSSHAPSGKRDLKPPRATPD